MRCVAAALRDAARLRRALVVPARVSLDDSRVGDTVRLVRRVDEAPVFDLAALLDPARFRVATPFACIAALARRGFSRVCWMLRLVMSPVRRAVRLVALRDFAEEPPVREDREEEDRFDLDAAAIVFPLVSLVKESTNLQ